MILTEHFSLEEFDCHDGSETPATAQTNLLRLCQTVLEPIRNEWGGPLRIISGWRSRLWNIKIGGAKASKHLTGEAADIISSNRSDLPELWSMLDYHLSIGSLFGIGGIGYYPGRWIHVDCRPRGEHGEIARWSGNKTGSEIT